MYRCWPCRGCCRKGAGGEEADDIGGVSESEEEFGDSDFELDVVPAVPTTTYVGRQLEQRERDLGVEPAPGMERLDTDVEFVLHAINDPDEEEAARAKAMADKQADLVRQHLHEDDAHRAAVPTHRERERDGADTGPRHKSRCGERGRGGGGGGGGGGEEQNAHGSGECDARKGGQVQGAKRLDMQHEKEDLEAAMERNELQIKQCAEAVEEQHAAGAVYTPRPHPHAMPMVESAEQEQQAEDTGQQEEHKAAEEISTPPMPAMNEAVHHDNLWKSWAGRKRKASVEKEPSAPRHGPRRPEKKTIVAIYPKQQRARAGLARVKEHGKPCKGVSIADDDPDSDDNAPQSSDEGSSPCESK
ncbi:hypothetical protein CBR_g28865 [Chara braunii]|uniref:Uncharacterized protein n=1 Tax=Chara braunii TaxID=69332 RepID=A0A388LA14_CHABU|nr:hypothetical protein CBR_g28865 [Chara braunii]|eukprot:GBG79150.1 hypothetical protein CBR_g28865 [Chara braunii]